MRTGEAKKVRAYVHEAAQPICFASTVRRLMRVGTDVVPLSPASSLQRCAGDSLGRSRQRLKNFTKPEGIVCASAALQQRAKTPLVSHQGDGPKQSSASSRWDLKPTYPNFLVISRNSAFRLAGKTPCHFFSAHHGEHEHCGKAGCGCCAQCTGAYPPAPVLQGCRAATRPAPTVVPAPIAADRRARHGYTDHRHAAAVRSGQGVWGWRQRGVRRRW